MCLLIVNKKNFSCPCSWEVHWDAQGIVVTQIATLDTLSSHILCITSTTLLNHEPPPPMDMQMIYFNSPDKRHRQSASLTSPRLYGVGPTSVGVMTKPLITQTQLVVATTNLGEFFLVLCCLSYLKLSFGCNLLGTIYIWRVHPYEFKGKSVTQTDHYCIDDTFVLLSVHPDFAVDVDSGKHLIAIVHASDAPIVKASLTLTSLLSPSEMTPRGGKTHLTINTDRGGVSDTGGLSKYLLLCTSDTSGAICIHSAPYLITSDTELTTLPEEYLPESDRETRELLTFCSTISTPYPQTPLTSSSPSKKFRRHTAMMNASAAEQDSFHIADNEDISKLIMFSLCGQAQYASPVVHCEFESKHSPVSMAKFFIDSHVTNDYLVDPSENPYKRPDSSQVATFAENQDNNSKINTRVDSHGHEHVHIAVKTNIEDNFDDQIVITSLNLVFLNDEEKSVNATSLLQAQQERLQQAERKVDNIDNTAQVNRDSTDNEGTYFEEEEEPQPRTLLPEPSPSASSKRQSKHKKSHSKKRDNFNTEKNNAESELYNVGSECKQVAVVYEDDDVSVLNADDDVEHGDARGSDKEKRLV